MVGVEVDQVGTIAEDDGYHAVLDHLPKLDVAEALEAGLRDVPRVVVRRVAQRGGSLWCPIILFKIITYFENVYLYKFVKIVSKHLTMEQMIPAGCL